ncbi:MAG: CDP-diacylglycerol--glycerol-3-phosphate 3-phosphatidyltransferase [Methylocystis sp.]|nr:MAG: CDP-diacylglycerol--glycerol-3-phosphate 3-phosphatidyltransferase [Methylocystis sp.]
MPEQQETPPEARRPLATRDTRLARRLTEALLRTPVTPDQISVASVGFAAVGALALLAAPASPWLFLVAAACVQLRLLCNLLDGMVAVEGGRGGPLGGLYNEVPDRIADSLFIVALGYAAGAGLLGWLGALLAALTAYIRALGGSLGLPQDFRGPLAKPHRMALLTGACVLALIEAQFHAGGYALFVAASAIAIGSAATCVTRLRAIAGELEGAARD